MKKGVNKKGVNEKGVNEKGVNVINKWNKNKV